jgi:hypothetical protein
MKQETIDLMNQFEQFLDNQFILISLDTTERKATEDEKQALVTLFNARPVLGSYKGQLETSFQVSYKHLDSMLNVAERFKQESILVSDGNKIYLVDSISLDHTKIGDSFRMSNVQPDVESWTLIDGVYLYV